MTTLRTSGRPDPIRRRPGQTRAALVLVVVAVATLLVPLGAIPAASAATRPITVSIGDASVLEGSTGGRPAIFAVTLSAPASTTVSVHYSVVGGTAQAGTTAGGGNDVRLASGTVTFALNTTTHVTPVSRNVKAMVFGDTVPEPNETFTVNLSAPTGGVTLRRATGTGTIIDDDASTTAQLGVGDASVVEGDLGPTRNLTLSIALSRPVTSDVLVQYTLADGTATGSGVAAVGADYNNRKKSGTIHFVAGGATTKMIPVPVWPDVVAEPDETFTLTLSGVTGPATVLRSVGTGTILDDDVLTLPGTVTVCGTRLCEAGTPWTAFGATFYNPGLTPYQSGIKDPAGTVALAQYAHLNTLRITNFLDSSADPTTAPYDETAWQRVDAMIAAAHDAGMHVDITLSDYRKLLWENCINPYTADWSTFVAFVSDRINTVTGVRYRDDPTIAYVSILGEPQPPGSYSFTAAATGQPCTISYTTAQLTDFYRSTTGTWKAKGGQVLVNAGGLSYLDLANNGIDWQGIFSLPSVDFCNIKTYGGMLAWAPTAVQYCTSIGKPIVDEEFGWTQNVGDGTRATDFANTYTSLDTLGFAGVGFWNLGYQLAPTSYEVNPSTPRTMTAVQTAAP